MVQHDFLLIMTTKPSKCNLNFKSNQQWKRTKKDLFETVKSEINYLAKNTDQKYLALLSRSRIFFDFSKDGDKEMTIRKRRIVCSER